MLLGRYASLRLYWRGVMRGTRMGSRGSEEGTALEELPATAPRRVSPPEMVLPRASPSETAPTESRLANSSAEGASFTGRAGTPTTVVIGSTSWVTTAPAPTID